LRDYFSSVNQELCGDCKRRINTNPLRVLDYKVESCQKIIKDAPKITDNLCDKCKDDFETVKKGLNSLMIEYLEVPTLVRGLDYYTNTAFEIKSDDLGSQDAIFAGGRYNGLVEEIGDRNIPGVGFALGLERLEILLEDKELDIESGIDIYIVTIGEKAEREGFKYLNQLREAGISADKDYSGRSVKSQMKDADRKDSNYTIILGNEELESGQATLRNMRSGEEFSVVLNELVAKINDLIDN